MAVFPTDSPAFKITEAQGVEIAQGAFEGKEMEEGVLVACSNDASIEWFETNHFLTNT